MPACWVTIISSKSVEKHILKQCPLRATSHSAWQQQQHRSIILSKMAVAPVTSSRTHSHATQLFWILNIIVVTIIALFYYPKTPKIWLLQKSKYHFWPLWPLAFLQKKQKPITLEAMGDIISTNITLTIQITKVVTVCFKFLSCEMNHVTQVT